MTLPTPTYYWNLDKSSSLTAIDGKTTTQKDKIGGATMTIEQAVWRPGKDGKADTSLRFNPKAGDGVRVVTTSVTELSSPTWTVSMWIKHEAKTGLATLLSSPSSSGAFIRLEQIGTASKLGVTKRSVKDYPTPDEIQVDVPVDDKWAHLVFVGTESTTKIYINGEAGTTMPCSIKLPLKWIGSTDGEKDFGEFLLDELKVFDTALTDAQVKELHDQKDPSETATQCWVWGDNSRGQLGVGNFTNLSKPTLALLRSGAIKTIAAGTYFSLALLEDGTLWAWGENNYGQLGISGTSNNNKPEQVTLHVESRIKALAGGRVHSVALLENGDVWAWGENQYQQHGSGSAAAFQAPEKVPMSDRGKPVAIAAGSWHSLALLEDGTVLSWGYNAQSELGIGDTSVHKTPVVVTLPGRAKAIAAGYEHSLTLLENGTVWAWGLNDRGQLGDGTTTMATKPTQVRGFTKAVIAIASPPLDGKFSYSVALLEDGTVWAWGYNNQGQLGDGTTASSYVPVQVLGLSDVKSIAAGGYHCMALKPDGAVWIWGYNKEGELGNNTMTAPSTKAAQVEGLSGIKAIAAGCYHSLAAG